MLSGKEYIFRLFSLITKTLLGFINWLLLHPSNDMDLCSPLLAIPIYKENEQPFISHKNNTILINLIYEQRAYNQFYSHGSSNRPHYREKTGGTYPVKERLPVFSRRYLSW